MTTILAHRGVEAYFPLVPSRRKPAQLDAPTVPLFPGYIFSRLEPATDDWIATRSAPGVAYVLGAGGVPSPLPDDLIEGIRRRVEARMREGWRPPFKRGERVLVDRGPFSGLEAIFDGALSPDGRVRVLLQIVNRLVPVSLDVSFIEQAGPAQRVRHLAK